MKLNKISSNGRLCKFSSTSHWIGLFELPDQTNSVLNIIHDLGYLTLKLNLNARVMRTKKGKVIIFVIK